VQAPGSSGRRSRRDSVFAGHVQGGGSRKVLRRATTAAFLLVLTSFGAARAQDAQPSALNERVADDSAPSSQSDPFALTSLPPPFDLQTTDLQGTVEPITELAPIKEEENEPWLDRTQEGLHRLVSGSSRRVDRWFGATDVDPGAYERASGSIAPALLWDEFDGFKPRLRFRADFPLPHISEKFNAFVGRVNRDEYVTERAQESGAIPRQFGPTDEDQTLLGISYRENPKRGGRWDAGAGVRLRFPLDPYVKGSYVFRLGDLDHVAFTIRETAFWQNSENLGLTNRFDLERLMFEQWLVRWTNSATFSQETEGLRGYSAISAVRGFPSRRAVTVEVGLDGETDAEVPLHDYGFKVAYRQAVIRDWLVLEVRSSLRWPREEIEQHREPSWGVGMGFEMFFGTEEFLARPVTF
jgi:hypothetical protein